MDPFPHLHITTEEGDRTVPLANISSFTMGRGKKNFVVIKDKWASRKHAMFQITEHGKFYLIDLGSLNGTYVNGRRVSIPVTLSRGDRITVGTTDMELVYPDYDITDATDGKTKSTQRSTMMLQQRRMITVLVVDIRNYTGLARELDEQILSQVIGSWFGQAGEIIQQHGSGVDKYIGDAVMAVWIHRISPKSKRVVAQEMYQVFKALNELLRMSDQLNQKFELPFRLRVGAGVNTGKAIVGQMGAGDRPEYTALGDTVNAAFRLETATKDLGVDVVIGESTYKECPHPDLLDFEQHEIMLRGYDKASATYAGTASQLDQFVAKLEGLNGQL
ncbi:adenylate/guanylate cyclase [Thalassoporum mexicanum PCC 7367]|uniref:adenylate/guanylate cyclase domain-containing protein n=1 Tax=Thalassoporum mexicanum TaxID=3457544 RepID=UPI00029FF0A0|nr:adenylate/guanylate cyclase domain-containing protein [Pseudanabaena sp. PCC 7367]AFY69474.1 adenylate/guanylate cyclase [Pseudanabaena sp. PCC 7367]